MLAIGAFGRHDEARSGVRDILDQALALPVVRDAQKAQGYAVSDLGSKLFRTELIMNPAFGCTRKVQEHVPRQVVGVEPGGKQLARFLQGGGGRCPVGIAAPHKLGSVIRLVGAEQEAQQGAEEAGLGSKSIDDRVSRVKQNFQGVPSFFGHESC